MARRSDGVAAWLSGLGIRRGQAVLVMLGNQVEMWEVTLGIMKLGAVIMPTTTAVGPTDLVDRIGSQRARGVVIEGASFVGFGFRFGCVKHADRAGGPEPITDPGAPTFL